MAKSSGEADERNIKAHQKYLAEPSAEWIQSRLDMFRIERSVFEALPIICLEDVISSKYARWRDWIHPLDPVSLDDLKNWFGVPNQVAKQQQESVRTLSAGGQMWGRYSRVATHRIPTKEFEFRDLDEEQRPDVLQMANNLLYGYVDPEEAKRPEIRAVIRYMIERSRNSAVSVFVAPSLIICPDHETIFSNTSALMFVNILIYGNGKLTIKGHTSIHAQQIQHI